MNQEIVHATTYLGLYKNVACVRITLFKWIIGMDDHNYVWG